MLRTNVSSIPKKGSTKLLKNRREIFNVSVIRAVLMKLIYNEKYPIIASNMSEYNVGSRKGYSPLMNIFIVMAS